MSNRRAKNKVPLPSEYSGGLQKSAWRGKKTVLFATQKIDAVSFDQFAFEILWKELSNVKVKCHLFVTKSIAHNLHKLWFVYTLACHWINFLILWICWHKKEILQILFTTLWKGLKLWIKMLGNYIYLDVWRLLILSAPNGLIANSWRNTTTNTEI